MTLERPISTFDNTRYMQKQQGEEHTQAAHAHSNDPVVCVREHKKKSSRLLQSEGVVTLGQNVLQRKAGGHSVRRRGTYLRAEEANGRLDEQNLAP